MIYKRRRLVNLWIRSFLNRRDKFILYLRIKLHHALFIIWIILLIRRRSHRLIIWLNSMHIWLKLLIFLRFLIFIITTLRLNSYLLLILLLISLRALILRLLFLKIFILHILLINIYRLLRIRLIYLCWNSLICLWIYVCCLIWRIDIINLLRSLTCLNFIIDI